jgi:hypothetical protein
MLRLDTRLLFQVRQRAVTLKMRSYLRADNPNLVIALGGQTLDSAIRSPYSEFALTLQQTSILNSAID